MRLDREGISKVLLKISFFLFAISPFISNIPFDIGLFFFFIGYLLKEKRASIFEKIDKPFIALFFAGIISIFFSLEPFSTLLKIRFFRFFLLVPFLKIYLEEEKKDNLLRIAIIAGIVVGSYIILTTLTNGRSLPFYLHYHFENDGRIIPQWSQVFFFYLIPSIYLISKREFFIPSLIFSLISLSIILLSKTRSTFIAIFCVSIVIPFLTSKKFLVFPISLIVGLFLYSRFYPSSQTSLLLKSVVNPFDRTTPRYGSNMERVEIIKEAFSRSPLNLITGSGFDSYEFQTKTSHKRIFSDIIHTLVCTGIIGLISFLWLIIHWFKGSLELGGKKSFVPISLLVGFLSAGLFEPNFYNTETLLSFLFLFTCYTNGHEENR